LYNSDSRTREISAWWLRRRIFGVFGPGEVYSQTVDTLNDATQPEARRVAAAEALGEFLTRAGVRHVAQAAIADSSAQVRLSAVRALKRLNSEGPAGELATAMADTDEQVRIAALATAAKINVFTGVAAVTERLADSSSAVRVRATRVLGQLRARQAVSGLVTLTDPNNEGNAEVRAAAVAALGQIGDSTARSAISQAENSDPDRFVRNAARIALMRL
jgi:HEAT repeat protein